MRQQFLDHVLELGARKRLVATLALSSDEEVFAAHFPANPILPASMIMESFAHAASVLIEVSSGFTRKGLPAFIQNAKFHKPVTPGSPLRIEMDVDQWSEEGAIILGRAIQSSTRCAVCTLGMVSAPLHHFYAPQHATAYRATYQAWLAGCAFTGFERSPAEDLRHALAG